MQKRQILIRDPDQAPAPLVGLAERYDAGDVAEHSHRRTQIMFAIEGAMTVLTAQGSWVLPSNRALWLPGSTPHALKMRRPVALRTLYLDGEVDWLPRRASPAVLQVPAFVKELILAAVDAPWDYAPGSAEARLAQVLCDRLISAGQEAVHLPEPLDRRARRLAAFYHADPAERRPLKTLASEAGASLRTLERLFVRETGLSIIPWTQQLRLLVALERLAHGASVGDAAFAVGFENPSSFIALFRRSFGTTPGRYFGRLP
jgi:AraC-like DNA-binding protein